MLTHKQKMEQEIKQKQEAEVGAIGCMMFITIVLLAFSFIHNLKFRNNANKTEESKATMGAKAQQTTSRKESRCIVLPYHSMEENEQSISKISFYL